MKTIIFLISILLLSSCGRTMNITYVKQDGSTGAIQYTFPTGIECTIGFQLVWNTDCWGDDSVYLYDSRLKYRDGAINDVQSYEYTITK